MKNRVVITGLGVNSLSGFGKEAFWNGLLNNESKFTEIGEDILGEGYKGKCGILDKEKLQQLENLYLSEEEKKYAGCSRLSLTTALMAIEDSKLEAKLSEIPSSRIGVSVGTTHGDFNSLENLNKKEGPVSYKRMHQEINHFDISASIARRINASGDVILHSDACASGNIAFAHAFEMIRSGRLDVVITGGVETESFSTEAGFISLKTVALDEVRPFDVNRSGILLSAGCGMLVLENYESAIKRGARIYCEVLGQGQSSDAYSIAAMDSEANGIIQAMENAVSEAGVKTDEVDYICLHGTGTLSNDACEMLAIKKYFGEHASKIFATSIKGTLGHSLGAAAAIELVACALSFETGTIPPNNNLKELDKNCVFNIPTKPLMIKPKVIMNNSYGFGGSNSCVILKKMEKSA